MLNLRPVLYVLGILLSMLSAAMLVPAALDLAVNNSDWKAFFLSAFFTAFTGIGLILTNRGEDAKTLSLRQAFLLTALTWIVLVAFGALPFLLAGIGLNYTDAYFEAMSGVTTTGASVMTGLDTMPPGILLWRAILNWAGGLGFIVFAMAVLPMLKIGGMQLFRTESSDKSEKILPRATQFAAATGGIYAFFTLAFALALWSAGMDGLDAICHSMAAIATGGFSTRDASVGYYKSAAIESILIVEMIVGALPFVLFIQLLRGRLNILRDSQARWFLALIAMASLALAWWLHVKLRMPVMEALRHAAFNVTSVVTTTGFASADYALWGNFAVALMFFLTAIGGCTGSTTGGIKIFRFQVLYETVKVQLCQLVQPHGVFRPVYHGKPIPEAAIASVMSFTILYATAFSVIAVLVALTGPDFLTSMSATIACLANVGPGLGEMVGPVGNYGAMPDGAKWLLTFAMLLGRLEIFTVLILFTPYFWRH